MMEGEQLSAGRKGATRKAGVGDGQGVGGGGGRGSNR